jgi:hypothetical protein
VVMMATIRIRYFKSGCLTLGKDRHALVRYILTA